MNSASPQQLLFDMSKNVGMDQREAESLVEPFLPHLATAMEEAFKEYGRVDSETRQKLAGGAHGQVGTRLIWEHVRDQLTGEPGVVFCDKLGFLKVVIDNQIILRFKRLNCDLLARSQGSSQAKAWFGNEPVRGIDSNLTRLTFGYRPESNWLTCEQFYVTHQSSFQSLSWASELIVVAAGSEEESVDSAAQHSLPDIRLKSLLRKPENADAEREA